MVEWRGGGGGGGGWQISVREVCLLFLLWSCVRVVYAFIIRTQFHTHPGHSHLTRHQGHTIRPKIEKFSYFFIFVHDCTHTSYFVRTLADPSLLVLSVVCITRLQ